QQPDAGGEEEGSSIGAADGVEKQLSVDDQQQQEEQPAVITADASDESGGKIADVDGGRKRPGLIAKLTTPIQKKNPADLVDHHGKEQSTSMEKGIGLMEGGQEDSNAHQGNNDDKGAAVLTGPEVEISASSVPGESNAQHQGATTDTYADDDAKKATTTTPSSSDAGLVHQRTPRSEVSPAGTAAAAATSVSPSSPSTARK
ncbi:hypothetical protein FOZ62_017156, partial [Perkinsus olseni]